MADAPVCHIPGTEIIDQPTGARIPNVPAATDLPSALRAIRVLTDIVRMLSGQLHRAPQGRVPGTSGGLPYRGQDGGRGTDGNNGGSGDGGGFRTQQKPPQWQEESRVEKKVKIFIGDSKEDFVEVSRIESLTMIDKGTKNRWKWNRER